MDCPVCGELCQLVYAGQDEFGTIREYSCLNCGWIEGDEVDRPPAE